MATEPPMAQIPTTRGLERLPSGKTPITGPHTPALDDPRSPLRDLMKSPPLDQPSSPHHSHRLMGPPAIERSPKTKQISPLQIPQPTAISRR